MHTMPKLVPNSVYATDLGVCLRTTKRWDKRRADATARKEAGVPLSPAEKLMLLVPLPIRINGRIYRDEEEGAEFRQALLGRAVEAISIPQNVETRMLRGIARQLSSRSGSDPPA
jgi:hypothetical protein